jgi:hypothetical protein
MSDPKPYASLSSGLLARKGGAKPAMRPQAFTNFGGNIEDLGWNDMGGEVEPYDHVPSSIAALTPAPNGRAATEIAPDPGFEAAPEPAVVEQQRALEESFQPAEPIDQPEPEIVAEPAPAPVKAPVVRLPKRRALPAASSAKAKSAFTLRLDPERHLRLRLACAVSGKSAQQLVTGALDEFLSNLPEVEELAGRVPFGQRSR